MNFSLHNKIEKTDVLFLFVSESQWNAGQYKKLIPASLEKQIREAHGQKEWEGKLNEMVPLCAEQGIKKIFLVGVGNTEKKGNGRKAAGTAMKKAKSLKAKTISFLLPDYFDLERAISGAILGNYEFKIGDLSKQFSITHVQIISNHTLNKEKIESEKSLAENTNYMRTLINLPANMMTPKVLVEKAKQIAKESKGKIKVKILEKKEIEKMEMGAIHAVGKGSIEEPHVIILEYFGGKKKEAPLAFVGKGVTFDAGGYNLKPTNHIETMKEDMAGAATVLGIFKWISSQKPKKNIVGVIGAVENLVSDRATKPGDVIKAFNGETIEITNTDAEGRLVLADCLYYTHTKYKPAAMIDIATLTGAVVVALGHEITGFMGNNRNLLNHIKKCANEADEEMWELPITDNFREKIKGEISDLMNSTSGVGAGSSMGGSFLEHFVGDTPWVHLDVAGTAFHEKFSDELSPKGATGVMMRTFRKMIEG